MKRSLFFLLCAIRNTLPGYSGRFALLVSTLYACSSECDKGPDVSGIGIEVHVKRLEQEMFNLKSNDEIVSFLNKNSWFSEKYLKRSSYPHDSVLINNIEVLITNEYLDTLYQECQEVFGDFSELKKDFESAFKSVKYYYPDFFIPEIYTVVTGFGLAGLQINIPTNDLFVSDSIIIIGIDYFLGEQARWRPPAEQGFYEYIVRRFTKEYIVPYSVMSISKKYNKSDFKNSTLLAAMIYYGKLYYFTKQILPCIEDSIIIGYTSREFSDCYEIQDIIWAHFIKRELLYQTSPMIITKYTGERPYTAEIGKVCPGRIGRWLGWEIIKKYMIQNTGVTLQDLMEDTDAQKIFTLSKYKPMKF